MFIPHVILFKIMKSLVGVHMNNILIRVHHSPCIVLTSGLKLGCKLQHFSFKSNEEIQKESNTNFVWGNHVGHLHVMLSTWYFWSPFLITTLLVPLVLLDAQYAFFSSTSEPPSCMSKDVQSSLVSTVNPQNLEALIMSGGDHFDYLENVLTTCEWMMVNILMLGVLVWYTT